MKAGIYLEMARPQNSEVAGWGMVISGEEACKKTSGGYLGTTHNRKYPAAVITAPDALGGFWERFLYTNPKYPCDEITMRITNWERILC